MKSIEKKNQYRTADIFLIILENFKISALSIRGKEWHFSNEDNILWFLKRYTVIHKATFLYHSLIKLQTQITRNVKQGLQLTTSY